MNILVFVSILSLEIIKCWNPESWMGDLSV